MKDSYYIKSGINNDVEGLKKLSIYIQKLESNNSDFCYHLNEVVENDPISLFEPKKIDSNSKFPIKDLAFVYCDNEIVAHLISIFNREKNELGYKTSVKIIEIYSSYYIPNNYFDEYIIKRLKGNLEIRLDENEKNNQK